MNDNNFFELEKYYVHSDKLDSVVTVITVKYGKQSYTVSEYADAGPESLHTIQRKLYEIQKNTFKKK
jgi:hypothetical protein